MDEHSDWDQRQLSVLKENSDSLHHDKILQSGRLHEKTRRQSTERLRDISILERMKMFTPRRVCFERLGDPETRLNVFKTKDTDTKDVLWKATCSGQGIVCEAYYLLDEVAEADGVVETSTSFHPVEEFRHVC
ncbi:unnamed protein product [Orchesella dallaii]|uniref:Uncharacterized protein n=1 Tax=Orchesella dallaii TaxID=48710 RepID=A0ABP1RJJ9_9HEXA